MGNINLNITEKFRINFDRLLNKNDAIKSNKIKIALAVSGGPDSMCMAALVKKWQNEKMEEADDKIYEIHCIIVDHKLRIESTEEAYSVKKELEKLFQHVTILTWNRTSDCNIRNNTHARARQARYSMLYQYCLDHGIQTLCTAHTYDDQAETVLMRIMRGSGIDGINGIRANTKLTFEHLPRINLVRPMLIIRKAEIYDFFESEDNTSALKYVEDPSNYNEKYGRTKIRDLLKYLEKSNITNAEKIKNKLNLLAENASRSSNYINSETTKTIRRIAFKSLFGYYIVDLAKFKKLHNEIKLRMLKKILCYVGNRDKFGIRLQNLEGLIGRITTNNINKRVTFCGCIVSIIHESEKSKKSSFILFQRELAGMKEQIISKQMIYDALKNGRRHIMWDGRFKLNLRAIADLEGEVSNMTDDDWRKLIRLKYKAELQNFETATIARKNVELKNFPNREIFMAMPAIHNANGTLVQPAILSSIIYYRI